MHKKRFSVNRFFDRRVLTFVFFALFSQALFSAPILPELEKKGVKAKVHEIMSNHAEYKKMEPLIVKRALKTFIQEIDPTKTYFVQSEIDKWMQPNDQMIAKVLSDYHAGHFEIFEEMYDVGLKALKRREEIETKIKQLQLPKEVAVSEFKDMEWAQDVDALQTRLLRLKALQLETAAVLTEENADITLQRLEKRRLKREEEFLSKEGKERSCMVYSLILKAVAGALDSHTAYFTPAEAEQFLIQVQQRLFGLGVQIRDDLNGFTVVKIIEGGPAADEKILKVNDKIVAVNGDICVGLDVQEVVEQIRGESSTPVQLTVLRKHDDGKEEKLHLSLKRGEVILKDTRMEAKVEPFGDGMIGYIKLFSFYQDPQSSSSGDMAKAIADMRKSYNLKGLVLDLRGNSGGILPQAVAVTGLFITKGVVCSVKTSDDVIQRLRDLDGKVAFDGPMVVLVNKMSASAAEIVTQTLQDYGRAVVVGDEHTFGKGTFQTFTLDTSGRSKVSNEGEFKVTRGKYYTVSGKSPQLVGAKADVVIPGPFCYEKIGEEYTSYPLANDSIPPQFDDDLADISALQHEKIAWLYRAKVQERLVKYNRHIDKLKENSKLRIENNKAYKKFLEDVKKDVIDPKLVESYENHDFQYGEALNVLKDLILLAA